jgi:hypothetical protein
MVRFEAAGAGWTAAQTALIIAAAIAILGSLVSASVTYTLNQQAARRDRQAKTFAEALASVEDYAELPYRVRRRHDNEAARHDLAEEVSRIQSRLAYHQALLQVETPEVAERYAGLVRAAKAQAGNQMRQAWLQPPITTDADMNLGTRHDRDDIDAARVACIEAMRSAVRRSRLRRFRPRVSRGLGPAGTRPTTLSKSSGTAPVQPAPDNQPPLGN